MTHASRSNMTLPYPYEVELGLMKPRPWVARTPFDVAHHLEDAIQVTGERLMVFDWVAPLPDLDGR